MASLHQYVTEVTQSKSWFGFKHRQRLTLDILDEASAAARVQEGTEAVLWVKQETADVFLTEKWGTDAVHTQVPIKVCINQQETAAQSGAEVPSVAVLSCVDGASAELFKKLALHGLPEWLSIRRSTSAKSLLVLADHWLVSEEQQALKLQHPDGHMHVLLQLDVASGILEAVLTRQGKGPKTYHVGSFSDAAKLLKQHSRPQQQSHKTVHKVLQELRPTAASVGSLLARLESAVMQHKGEPSMSQWLRGGILAALVDCAASLGSQHSTSSGGGTSSSSSASPYRQSTGGIHTTQRSSTQQPRSSSMPGAAPGPQTTSSRVATLQALAECVVVVLQYADAAAAQEDMLVSCTCRALLGGKDGAVCTLQLLRMVLRHLSAAGASPLCSRVCQACCDMELLYQLQHCLAAAVPQQQPGQLLSHQLEGLNADTPSEPTTPIGPAQQAPGSPGPFQWQQTCRQAEVGTSTPSSPHTQPHSRCPGSPHAPPHSPTGGTAPRRHSLVPKLHLPVPVTPAPNSASRLSSEPLRSAVGGTTSSADKALTSGREAPGSSFLKALQQLGHSCGQSVMAADLAAFVTHKQLLGGVVAVEAALQHSRSAGSGLQPGGGSSASAASARLSPEELGRLSPSAQMQMEVLELLLLLAGMPSSGLMLPRHWEHLLLTPLLMPRSTWLQHCTAGVAAAGEDSAAVADAYRLMRYLTLELIKVNSSRVQLCLQDSAAEAMLMVPGPVSLHHPVLEHIRMQLDAARTAPPPGASAHGLCGELLGLLRDYFAACQQPRLADTACFMLGGVLAQQEHMLRATRMQHWTLDAVMHMDALVQLYSQLLSQVTSPSAAAWLLTVLGVTVSRARPPPYALGSSSTSQASPGPPTPVPADTLQLVLDYMRVFLEDMSKAAADSCSSTRSDTPAGATPHHLTRGAAAGMHHSSSISSTPVGTPGGSVAAASSRTAHLSQSVLAALQGATGRGPSSAGLLVAQLKANCWVLLNRLLLLARCQLVMSEPAASTVCSSTATPRGLASTTGSARGQPSSGLISMTPGSARDAAAAAGPADVAPAAGGYMHSPSLTPHRRPWLPLLALPNSGGSFSRTPSCAAALSAGCDSGREGPLSRVASSNLGHLAAGPPGSCVSVVVGDSSAPGRCSIWQLLVELLMVNSSMGQAAALQQLAQTHDNRVVLPLQQAVVSVLSTILGTPDSYAFSKPQLGEFYVHHHFLHFTQHYHKLPSSPAGSAALLCRSHLQVLLALCRQTGGANQVRRRFLQLKVLGFLAREASLEYMVAHNQLAPSPSSSACSTPLSTTRNTGRSCRGSARGASRTDPGGLEPFLGGGLEAAAAAGGSSSARHVAERGSSGGLLALGGVPGDRGSGSEGSAGAKLLQLNSPAGCHVSARSASKQGVTRGPVCTPQVSTGDRQPQGPAGNPQSQQHQQRGGVKATGGTPKPSPAAARAVAPASFELHNLQVAGDQNMLLATGSSDTLTSTGSLLRGDSGAFHTPLVPRGGGSSSRGGGDSDCPDKQAPGRHEQQQQQQGAAVGSNVKAAVQAFESKAAAAGALQLQPTPPKKPGMSGSVGGRRQPGHRRLVCALGSDQAGPGSDAATTAAAGAGGGGAQPGKALQSVCELQQLQEQPDSSTAGPAMQKPQLRLEKPPIPKLQLPSGSLGSSAAQQQQQQQHPQSTVNWQALDPDSPGSAGDASNSSSSSPRVAPSSPLADLVGYEVPASVRSRRRIQQPALTGDASMDNIIIDNWERETGQEFQFDGLSDSEQEELSGSGGSSTHSTPREGVAGGSSRAGTQGYPRGSFLRPQTPELAAHQQLQSAAAGGQGAPWSMPQLVLGVEGRQGRWISSSDSVEDATAADDGLFLGKVQLPVPAGDATLLPQWGKGEGGACRGVEGQDHQATSTAVRDEAASVHDPSHPHGTASKAQVPKLKFGGLGSTTTPTPAHKAALGVAEQLRQQSLARSCSPAPESPSDQGSDSYRPGFDLEEDFERMMLAGEWEDSDGGSGDGGSSDHSSDDGSDAGSEGSDAAAAAGPQPQQQDAQQRQRQQLVPALHLQQQQQQTPEQPVRQGHSSNSSAAADVPAIGSRSPDTCDSTDVRASKRKAGPKGKGRKVGSKVGEGDHAVAEAGERVAAHALGDISGSSGSDDGGSAEYNSSSSSDGEQEGSSRPGSAGGDRPPISRAGLPDVPRLNLPQLQNGTWHLPMNATVLQSHGSSDAGLSSSRTASTAHTSSLAGMRVASLQVMPLSTSRLSSCGGGGGGGGHGARSAPGNSRVPEGPSSSTAGLGMGAHFSSSSGRTFGGPGSSARGGGSGPTGALHWSHRLTHGTQGHSVSPAAAGHVHSDPYGCPRTPSAAGGLPSTHSDLAHMHADLAHVSPYLAHRARASMYLDQELHVLCMQLALHLLVTPSGQLDPVQLPAEPSDTTLARKVMLLMEHLSHSANLDMTLTLAQHAVAALQQTHQAPLPISSEACSCDQQQQQLVTQAAALPQQQQRGAGSSALACADADACVQMLRTLCASVWDSSSCVGQGASAGGSSSSSCSAGSTAAAAAGLAGGTLRLLKLLCLPVLDPARLSIGGMINKGAFSEVMEGKLQPRSGGPAMKVAVKVMDCTDDDACGFERVYNEVVSLEALWGQPSVVPLLEYGVTCSLNGARQWVMVFPRYASSMREWRLRRSGRGLVPQDLPIYLRLFMQVASAVAMLHDSNIVHFDIKGDNVLLQEGYDPAASPCTDAATPSSSSSRPAPPAAVNACSDTTHSARASSSSSGGQVVLADFGDAMCLDGVQASSQRHRGTELFSSPEMLLLHAGRQHAQHAQHDRRKHRGVQAAHDVWSLGCTLYELLTGSVLFEDEGVGRITSYSSSQSSGGGAHSLRPDARGWGVLNACEKAALAHHRGCIELVESMLVGEPNWRPTAEQVVVKTQRLLGAVLSSS